LSPIVQKIFLVQKLHGLKVSLTRTSWRIFGASPMLLKRRSLLGLGEYCVE